MKILKHTLFVIVASLGVIQLHLALSTGVASADTDSVVCQPGYVTNPTDPTSCVTPERACEITDGVWVEIPSPPNENRGSSFACDCPGNNVLLNSGCVSQAERDCVNSDGEWVEIPSPPNENRGSSFACDCPGDEVLVNGRCEVPTSDSGSTGTTGGQADTGGRASLASNDPTANCEPPNGDPLDSENCRIIGIIVDAINILSGLAGLAIVASLVIAGYQYMTARDNAGQIQKAKTRIIWALSALALFIFMYAILNFLVPGGVL